MAPWSQFAVFHHEDHKTWKPSSYWQLECVQAGALSPLIKHFDNAGCKTHFVCTEEVLKMFQEENILVEFKVAVSKGILC